MADFGGGPGGSANPGHKLAALPRVEIPVYIINLRTGTRIEFVHVPEEISDSHGASFDSQIIRGRSVPVYGYGNSGPRSLSVSFELHDDYCKGGIVNVVNKIRALTYPIYEELVEAPSCYARIGQIAMQAVCSSVSVSWKKPIRDGIYISAEVSLDFEEVRDIPFSASDIEGGAHTPEKNYEPEEKGEPVFGGGV